MSREPRARVLVVDDEQMVLMSLELLLGDRWIVDTASSAAEARAKIQADEPMVAIVDARMPTESGLALLSWIQDHHPGIVRILLTGYADMDTVEQGVNTGRIWHFVRKPWNNDVLVNLVQRGIEHREAREALQRSEARHRKIVNNALVGLLVTDEAGTMVEVNPALAESLQSSPDALLGSSLAGRIVSEGGWAALVERLKVDGSVQQELVLLTDSGGESHVLFKAIGTASPDGLLIEASVLDLSAQRAAVQEGHQLRSRLRQAQRMGAIGGLAGGLVHDFNNLLTVILSCAGTIREIQDHPILYECAIDIEETTRQAADISQQLLSLFRGAPPVPRPVSVFKAVERISRLMRRVVDPDRVTVEMRVPDDLPEILMGAGRLELCLLNLCLNAYEAIPGTGQITLLAERLPGAGGDWVQVSVVDTGEGIPLDTQARIFEPFFTTRTPGAIGGTGLGLSMVRRLVDQGRGNIALQSTPGEGTRFTLSFPALLTSGSEGDGSLLQYIARGAVLLLDDDPALNERLVASLKSAEIDAVAATTVADGAALLLHRPDIRLVIVEQALCSVTDFRAQIGTRHPGLRQLFVGARLSQEDAALINAEPGVSVLHKPFTTPQLIGAIRAMLREE